MALFVCCIQPLSMLHDEPLFPSTGRMLTSEARTPGKHSQRHTPRQHPDCLGTAGQLEVSSEEGTLFWVRYMRFLRRNDNLAASRKAFLRARKWAPCGWQVRMLPVKENVQSSSLCSQGYAWLSLISLEL